MRHCIASDRPNTVTAAYAAEAADVVEASAPRFSWDEVIGIPDICDDLIGTCPKDLDADDIMK